MHGLTNYSEITAFLQSTDPCLDSVIELYSRHHDVREALYYLIRVQISCLSSFPTLKTLGATRL